MLGMGNSGPRGKIFAVADIGSGSASVAICAGGSGKPARIIAAASTILPIEDRKGDATMTGVISALSESANKAFTAAQALKTGHVQDVYAIIRAPWTKSKAIRAAKKLPSDEKINDAVIGALAQEALGGEKDLDRANLLEASVVRVELNGYPTAKPVGKRAHAVVVSAIASECEPRMKSAVEETLTRVFSSKPSLRSGTRALLTVLRERSVAHADYLIVDMTSEATSIVSIHKSTPMGYVVVPEGTRTILKRVAGKGLPEETLTLIGMLARDHCEDAACDSVREGMAKVEQDLIKTFGEAMAKLTTVRRLPKNLVLSAESPMAEWLSHFFSRIDFTQFTITAQPFSVEILNSKDLASLVESQSKTTDIGILSAAALVNSEL